MADQRVGKPHQDTGHPASGRREGRGVLAEMLVEEESGTAAYHCVLKYLVERLVRQFGGCCQEVLSDAAQGGSRLGRRFHV
ncbi:MULTISPECIES: hypothetical protein [unclassified Streptomyces]|uniref:hypothetical protein n=1 Tax=unclassified Streptomyces TaxID=2593676 RepID=UPI00117CE088|nr:MULTISPECIES: hypothetical protein [unclassified Streptomyces]MYT96015.1 hypothetical protein [Streptomyces sp. SID8350]MYU00012.1 hypothetical protein [Streptomyces sp. SID8350]